MFAESDQKNLSCLEDGAHSHRNGPLANIFLAKKVACCVPARYAIERDQSCPRRFSGTRFVKANMSGPAYSENLDIDATSIDDGLLILLAGIVNILLGKGAIWNMDIIRVDIDEFKQIFLHKTNITLQLIWLHRKIFIEVECDDVG